MIATLVDEAIGRNDFETLQTAAGNWKCGAETLDLLSEVPDIYTVLHVVRHQRTTSDTLDRIFTRDPTSGQPTRLTAFRAATANDTELGELVEHAWRHIEVAAANHVNLSPRIRRWLAAQDYGDDIQVIRALANRNDLSDAELIEFATRYPASVRVPVATTLHQDPDRIPSLLEQLQQDPHPFVSGAACGKSRTEILREQGEATIAETKTLPQGLQPPSGPRFG
jgi:hypothetical protein